MHSPAIDPATHSRVTIHRKTGSLLGQIALIGGRQATVVQYIYDAWLAHVREFCGSTLVMWSKCIIKWQSLNSLNPMVRDICTTEHPGFGNTILGFRHSVGNSGRNINVVVCQ